MLQQKTKFFKKYKLNQLQTIKQNYKYIYFFRYNDFSINKLTSLKKKIKKLNYKFLIINQKLTSLIFTKLEGQGSILIIYGNKDLFLIKNLIHYKKLKLIYLFIQNNIYSYLKIKQLINLNSSPFTNQIIQPFLNFIYYLRKI
jgi:ribosomal protein L10